MKLLNLFGLLSALAFSQQHVQTGFDQTGAVHLTGPGIDTWGAYDFYFAPPTFYRFKVVVPDGELLRGLPPDILLSAAAVSAQGNVLGHYIWAADNWRLEMICVDETVRTQVSWEAERMGFQAQKANPQKVAITIGRDSITFTVTIPGAA